VVKIGWVYCMVATTVSASMRSVEFRVTTNGSSLSMPWSRFIQ
jgi:hypothetical protein